MKRAQKEAARKQQESAERMRRLAEVRQQQAHPERIFTLKPKRHCSGCPFAEGCMSCDLP